MIHDKVHLVPLPSLLLLDPAGHQVGVAAFYFPAIVAVGRTERRRHGWGSSRGGSSLGGVVMGCGSTASTATVGRQGIGGVAIGLKQSTQNSNTCFAMVRPHTLQISTRMYVRTLCSNYATYLTLALSFSQCLG